MSKIICDVCGTSYPETATQCPICGCVRPGDVVTVAGNTGEADPQPASTYTYVKGGRFSKANVKKRNQGRSISAADPNPKKQVDPDDGDKKDRGLVIAVAVLLVAIVAVVVYIALRLWGPVFGTNERPDAGNTGETSASTSTEDTQDTTESTVLQIPCSEIVISKQEIRFDKKNAALLLDVSATPAQTTDTVVFASSDESVATVTQEGKVTAVGGGQAVITVSCGSASAECRVICDIEPDETETTAPSSVATEDFKLNREDFTMSKKGDSWKLYSGDIPADQITWTSDDDSVATVKDGVVTAVGAGMTTVYGEYGSVKLSCIVRCADSVGKASATETAPSGFSISAVDVTIKVGETFELKLTDPNGETVSVTWTAVDGAVCSANGNTITGLAAGITTVSATHDGVPYACIVRVEAA